MYLVENINCVRLEFYYFLDYCEIVVITVVHFMIQIWDVTPCLLGVPEI